MLKELNVYLLIMMILLNESFRENKFYKIIKKSNKTQRTKSFNPRTPKSNLNGKRKKKQV